MGKHKHSKDKLYKTVQELKSHHVGPNRDLELSALHRRLKFDSCCLSLNTLTDEPMGLCDDDGFCYVFEQRLILKFLSKFQIHPITGQKAIIKDLIALKFHKNADGQYHCPVIYKPFNQRSKICVNKKNGNVYAYEAYQQLNLKPKNFRDCLTDEPFSPRDIVTLQDPEKADIKWRVADFHYVKNKLKIEDDDSQTNVRNIENSDILISSLEEYKSKVDSIVQTFNRIVGQQPSSDADKSNVKLDKINSATYSDGTLASSVTSTVAPVQSNQRPALLSEEDVVYPRIKKKGYLQLVTNHGPLNLELFCDKVPKTCHNFFLLASRGYYDGTCFHRLIKNFILQGGDPTGTGSGGQSAWGGSFKDECRADLKHDGRGVLAMANSGANTNKSQFYIILKGAWDHLDGKHTVFGRVVGGEETLRSIEEVATDKNDRPTNEIKVIRVIKYVDPFEEVETAIKKEREDDSLRKDERDSSKRNAKDLKQPMKKFRSGAGAYIDLDRLRKAGAKSQSHDRQTVESTTSNGNVVPQATSLSERLASLKGSARH